MVFSREIDDKSEGGLTDAENLGQIPLSGHQKEHVTPGDDSFSIPESIRLEIINVESGELKTSILLNNVQNRIRSLHYGVLAIFSFHIVSMSLLLKNITITCVHLADSLHNCRKQ